MTQLKKRAIWTLVIWSTALIALLITFFSEGGPSEFLQGESKVTLSRVYFTAGIFLYLLMMMITRLRSRGNPVIQDERDELISRRAYMAGFTILLIYVFLLSVSLYAYYKVYKTTQLMPVGWIWFLGLSTFFLGYIFHAVVTLVLYTRMSGHGES